MHWLAIAVVAAFGVILVRNITAGEDMPGQFENPWLDLDIGNLNNLQCIRLSDNQFEVKAQLKGLEKRSVVQLTKNVSDGSLHLLLQRADMQPVSSHFLYTLTDSQGNFKFKFNLPESVDKIDLKYSGHVLWSRNAE